MSEDITGRVVVQLVKHFDYSKVKEADVIVVQNILVQIYKFWNPVPDFDVAIHNTGTHYNINLKNHSVATYSTKFYPEFLGEHRSGLLERVLDVVFFSHPTPIIVIKVATANYIEPRIPREDFSSDPTRNQLILKKVQNPDYYIDVKEGDIPNVRHVVTEIYSFWNPVPDLDIEITPAGTSHYNIQVKGHTSATSMKQFYPHFLGERRASVLEYVREIVFYSHPIPIMVVQVSSLGYKDAMGALKSLRTAKLTLRRQRK